MQKLLNHAKQSVTDALKTASKRAIQKTTEATGDLIGNKIADNKNFAILSNEAENIDHDNEIPGKGRKNLCNYQRLIK